MKTPPECAECGTKYLSTPYSVPDQNGVITCMVCYSVVLLEALESNIAMTDADVLPRTKAEAQSLGHGLYYPGDPCPLGRHPLTLKAFGKRNTGCVACEGAKAIARAKGLPTYKSERPCVDCGERTTHLVKSGNCIKCHPPRPPRDPARAEARRKGQTYYTPAKRCPDCDSHADRRTQDDMCTGCAKINRPPRKVNEARALARRTHSPRYMPTTPCENCGRIAERRTQDNRCYGCKTSGRSSCATTLLMKDNPDMVILRPDAMRLGFKVFRSGKPCASGHTGWRYVSTRGCVDCLKGKS